MTLTNEDREAIVSYRIENAHKELKALQILIDNELWNNAMSRLYYACFYAVSALLISYGIETQTHRGVRSMLALHFIKDGKIAVEWNIFYTRLLENRHIGDYEDFFDFDKSTVMEAYQKAIEFIEIIEPLIKKN
ncbi:HEPN domain-containing protein [Parabacteroides sp. PF5-6]|uniref:HEPN domain-containing protein n=1 Tax=Parabacteroides sp. PF5-6 TaxID=1742403 RepID=UPI002406B2B1|nr:HEPN domain-containing protein [Parabacteroides sp. PF5-6]MDF9829068.1 uncharacterized protein (UPF0332 family) [Parabacteroides sp. PF5-6]